MGVGIPLDRRWCRLAALPKLDEGVVTDALEMCCRVLPVRVVAENVVEGLVDDSADLPAQIQMVHTILNDQLARQKLQARWLAELDAQVTQIVRRVSGVVE